MLIYPSLLSNTAGIQETMSSTTKKKRTATPSSIKSFFSPKVEDPDASVKAPTQKILSANFQVDYSSYVEKLGEDTVERVLKRGLDELDELSIDVDGATNDCSSSVRRSSRKRLKVEEEVVEKQDVVQADVPKYEIGTLVEKVRCCRSCPVKRVWNAGYLFYFSAPLLLIFCCAQLFPKPAHPLLFAVISRILLEIRGGALSRQHHWLQSAVLQSALHRWR